MKYTLLTSTAVYEGDVKGSISPSAYKLQGDSLEEVFEKAVKNLQVLFSAAQANRDSIEWDGEINTKFVINV